jgi:hypothetical protein
LSYIATRPGALVYIPRNEEKDQGYYISGHNKDEEEIEENPINCDQDCEQAKTLYCRDVTLFLLLNLDSVGSE